MREFIESGLSKKVMADREIKRDVDEIMRRAEKTGLEVMREKD